MDLPEDSQRIFQKDFKMSVAVTVTMDCEYPDCPTSKTGKDMAECIEQMKFHINGKHANAAAAPAASFTIKSEEKRRNRKEVSSSVRSSWNRRQGTSLGGRTRNSKPTQTERSFRLEIRLKISTQRARHL